MPILSLHILTVVGTRPQFIKAAMVSRALAEAGVRETLVHTGQHYDPGMSEVFFAELGIPAPAVNLGASGETNGAMTGRMLEGLERILGQLAPDCVLVYGDTNSTLAGALAASALGLPVAHVEAGLRSFDRSMPEEVNRVVADHLARLHFCPTPVAVENLAREGVRGDGVMLVGDVMFDAAQHFRERARQPSIDLPGRFALATLHRPANVDDPRRLAGLLAGLEAVGGELPVLLLLHPRTARRMDEAGLRPSVSGRLILAPAVGYLEMLWLLDRCSLVLTDSGGLQKESCFFARPCVVLRGTTEWVELLESGHAILSGPEPEAVLASFQRMRQAACGAVPGVYGGGTAAQRIAQALVGWYGHVPAA